MDEASLRVRMATREIFDACFPQDDFDRVKREDFPRYRSAKTAAHSTLGLETADLPQRRYLTAADVAFEIRFALGQAPASIFVDVRSKDRTKQERALKRLVELVSQRFASTDISRTLQPEWSGSPFANVQSGPGYSR